MLGAGVGLVAIVFSIRSYVIDMSITATIPKRIPLLLIPITILHRLLLLPLNIHLNLPLQFLILQPFPFLLSSLPLLMFFGLESQLLLIHSSLHLSFLQLIEVDAD